MELYFIEENTILEFDSLNIIWVIETYYSYFITIFDLFIIIVLAAIKKLDNV